MSGNFAPVPSRVQNPSSMQLAMTNELVLRVLAKHASPSDLKTYREVCSKWNLIMTPGYNHNAIATFKTIYKMLVYTLEMDAEQEGAHRHRNFNIHIPITKGQTEEIDPANYSPFFLKYSHQIHNLKLLITLNPNSPQNLRNWLGLLGNLGNITSLELDVDFYILYSMNNFGLDQVPVMLSLEKLKFGISHKVGQDDPGHSGAGVDNWLSRWGRIILMMGPNLRCLSLKKIQFYKMDYTRRFQAHLMTFLAVVPPRVPNLVDFEIAAVAGTLKELLKLNTPIRKLKLIWSPTESQGLLNWIDLNDLLARNSETLEEISISLTPTMHTNTNSSTIYIGLRFPFMPRLKAFHMQLLPQMEKDSLCQIKIPFASVDYATSCPLLEELTLDVSSYHEVNDAMLSPTKPVCHSLKRISISADETICEESFKLKGRFPNALIRRLREDKEI